ncbi:hypothetical protein [Chitinophaga alhagiae]|uniref:hypothetical protein n=1 Tax=Chitinophaga alhagiae TaxID=2203219 RepID=UPI00130034D8|nr:hypothetical protein [Chitinophaga alhagiae]
MRYFLWIILGACLGGCKTYPANVTGSLYVQKDGRASKKWTLVWEDNFNNLQPG